jgi:hypothetical protein
MCSSLTPTCRATDTPSGRRQLVGSAAGGSTGNCPRSTTYYVPLRPSVRGDHVAHGRGEQATHGGVATSALTRATPGPRRA